MAATATTAWRPRPSRGGRGGRGQNQRAEPERSARSARSTCRSAQLVWLVLAKTGREPDQHWPRTGIEPGSILARAILAQALCLGQKLFQSTHFQLSIYYPILNHDGILAC